MCDLWLHGRSGRLGAREATPALLESLKAPDVSRHYAATVFGALGALGNPRAIPVLEDWARSRRESEIRLDV